MEQGMTTGGAPTDDVSCGSRLRGELADPPEVDVWSVQALLAADTAGSVVLLDVRGDAEWEAGHAPTAVHLPLPSLNPLTAPGDDHGNARTSQTLLVISRQDCRSTSAVSQLTSAGFTATRVRGGMQSWHRAGLPVVTNDGAPGCVV